MPAEAGLDERAISFTKGCYPGQEPVARLHYRGHANRGVRGLAFAATRGRGRRRRCVSARRRSAASPRPPCRRRHGSIALAVLRREVPDGAEVDAGGVAGAVKALPFGAAMA